TEDCQLKKVNFKINFELKIKESHSNYRRRNYKFLLKNSIYQGITYTQIHIDIFEKCKIYW
ncbi:hypothetical protein NS115_23440, partial [Paenibacillus jamilae]